MFPNVKIVIGGILLSIILLAATGSGMVTPQTYTRIGEMPEVGRPMMQQMFTDQTAPARFHILTLSRRTEELNRLRELPVQQTMAETPSDEESQVAAKPAVVELADGDAAADPTLMSVARVTLLPPETTASAQPPAAVAADGEVVKPEGVAPPVDTTPSPTASGDDHSDAVALTILQPQVEDPSAAPAILQLVLPRARPAGALRTRTAKHRAKAFGGGRRLARAPAPDPAAGLFGSPLPQTH